MLVVVMHDYWLRQRSWLIEHTCRIFSSAHREIGILTRLHESLLAINKHGEFVLANAPRMFVNVLSSARYIVTLFHE